MIFSVSVVTVIRLVRCTIIIIGIVIRTVKGIKIMRTITMIRVVKEGGTTNIKGMMRETVQTEEKMDKKNDRNIDSAMNSESNNIKDSLTLFTAWS